MSIASHPPRFPAWNDQTAANLDAPQLLLYRSNLLGSDLRITNYGGGNTSAKIWQTDPLSGESVEVLWVKGSGGDVGSMKLDGFATLWMDKLRGLKKLYRGLAHEDSMVDYLPHCTFNLNPRAASIDTPLHAALPYAHIDHMHPDAVIAIAAMENSQRITQTVFDGQVGWLPWLRPGYELGQQLAAYDAAHPGLRGIVLSGHGLFSWGDTSKSCFENTVGLIERAQNWLLKERAQRKVNVFGGTRFDTLPASESAATLHTLMPLLRGLASKDSPKLLHLNTSDEVLAFVNSHELTELAHMGTSCPDHFLRTKIRPLIIPEDLYGLPPEALKAKLADLISGYCSDYAAYYDRCKRPGSPAMRDPNPVVVLLPRIGMVTMAKDKSTARIAGEFYVNAINVMREAHALDRYVGLPEQEAFDIEYWLLEEAKLQRMPKPKPLVGKVALVTGAAGGIGSSIAQRLLSDGACVVLTDIAPNALQDVQAKLAARFGKDSVHAVVCDVNQANSEGIGRAQVQLMAKLIGGKGEFAILSATPNATNQNTWIKWMQEELEKPEYKDMKLVKIAYGNDDDQKSFIETQGLLQAYPNLKGIISPTTVGISAAARYLSTSPMKGKVQLTGLGTPNQMREYIKNGTVIAFQLWNPADLGYLAAYAAGHLASGHITGKAGETFTAGKLGKYTVGEKGEVILGAPTTFDKNNIDKFNY